VSITAFIPYWIRFQKPFHFARRNSISNDRRAHDYVCILMSYKSENEIHYHWHRRAVMAETKSGRGLSRTTKNFGLFNFSFRCFRNDSGGKFRFNAYNTRPRFSVTSDSRSRGIAESYEKLKSPFFPLPHPVSLRVNVCLLYSSSPSLSFILPVYLPPSVSDYLSIISFWSSLSQSLSVIYIWCSLSLVPGRLWRWPPRQDLAHVRPERIQLSPVRDILHHRQRVHGLGADSPAPDQHQGRDNCSSERRPVRGSSGAHGRHAQPAEDTCRRWPEQGAEDKIVFLRVWLSDQGRRLSSG